MAFRLKRRTFLAGVGGAAVSLPLLEAMGGNRAGALAPDRPPRFVVMYGGTSADNDLVVPSEVGSGFGLTRGTASLAGSDLPASMPSGSYNARLASGLEHGDVRDAVAVVSGLKIPWEEGGEVPPGGKTPGFHYNTVGPTLSGRRSPERGQRSGESADETVATAIAGDTRFRALHYRAQVESYRGTTGTGARSSMSWKTSGGRTVDNNPTVSPSVAYESLFTGFAGEDPIEAERRRRELAQGRSIVGLVRESTERLMGRVGSYDRERLERHFEEIRALERRILETPEAAGGACRLLEAPGADPEVRIRHCSEIPGNDCRYEYYDGYAGEEERARNLCDLLHMAIACDLTRVATLLLTFHQSFLNMSASLGYDKDIHSGIGHSANVTGRADVIAWHLKWLAYLVDKLRNTPEGDGNLLDNTVLVLMFEGGWGFDPEGGRNDTAHSTENMIAFVAGAGIEGHRHLRTADAHPAKVLVSAMQAIGVDTERLGDITGGVSGL